MDDNRAVESFGSWILNLTDLKSEPAGTESCIIPYPASEATSLKLELDVVNELIFEVSDSADEISIKMENGYQDYLSTKQKDSDLKVSYHSGHHHLRKDRPYGSSAKTVRKSDTGHCSGSRGYSMEAKRLRQEK